VNALAFGFRELHEVCEAVVLVDFVLQFEELCTLVKILWNETQYLLLTCSKYPGFHMKKTKNNDTSCFSS
jgi:hypothetical protein